MTGQSDNGMTPPGQQNSSPAAPPPPGGLRRVIQKINPVISQTISRLKQMGQSKPASSAQPWPTVQSPPVSLPPSHSPQIESPSPTGSPPPPSQPGVLLNQMHPPPPLPPQPGAGQPGVFQRVVKKIDPVIAKTKIDLEACGMVMSQALASKEEKVKELKTTSTTYEPIKIVEGYKKAVPCDAAWENMSGTDQFRLCSKCRLNIYDFSNMNDDEAKALVFKREALTPEIFFQRKDGRFLIRDCPVAVNRARTLVACIVGGGLLTISLFYWAMTQPPPKPAITTTPETAPSGTSAARSSFSNSKTLPAESGKPSSTSGKYSFTYTNSGQTATPTQLYSTPAAPPPQQAGFKLPDAAPIPELPPAPAQPNQGSDGDALRGL